MTEIKNPSKVDWALSKQAIKLVIRMSKNDPYVNELAKNCQKALKKKDYPMYRENMDNIQIHYAKLAGKTHKEFKKDISSGYDKFKQKFSKKKKQEKD